MIFRYSLPGHSSRRPITRQWAFPSRRQSRPNSPIRAREVVSLVGDGGFLMSGFESLNAARWNAKIIIVVFRDGAWGLIKEAQQRVYRRTPFTEIPSPDFRSFGPRTRLGTRPSECGRRHRTGPRQGTRDKSLGAGRSECRLCRTTALRQRSGAADVSQSLASPQSGNRPATGETLLFSTTRF